MTHIAMMKYHQLRKQGLSSKLACRIARAWFNIPNLDYGTATAQDCADYKETMEIALNA